MIPKSEDLAVTCAIVSVTRELMRAYAAYAGWGDYDVEEDPQELGDLADAMAVALVGRGFIDLEFIERFGGAA